MCQPDRHGPNEGRAGPSARVLDAAIPPTDAINAAPALDLSRAKAGTVVTGNVFYDDRVPLSVNVTYNLDDSNSFDNSALAPSDPQPSEFNGIIVAGCSTIDGNLSWTPSKAPLVIGDPISACSYLNVAGAGHLTLGANTVMKFFQGGVLNVDTGGAVTAPSTAAFTSIRDDSRCGDTNACGGSLMPNATDWVGVKIDGACQTWSNIYYATCQ